MQRQPFCLIVEPEWGMRNLLDDVLSVSGVKVTTLQTDAQALRFLRSSEGEAVDVVLCQAPPPGAKHSLVGKVRQGPTTDKLPVICISPSGGLPDRAQAFDQGASEYLVRPVSPVTLEERVRFWANRDHRPFG